MDENQNVTEKKRSMSFFMKGKAKQVTEVEEVVSKRFTDNAGNPVKWVFKPLGTKRIEEIQQYCTEPVYRKGRKVDEKLNATRFAAMLGVETTIYPNLKDQELLKSYNQVDPVELVKEILNVGGEYAEWLTIVQRVNGYDEEFGELVDEAKN